MWLVERDGERYFSEPLLKVINPQDDKFEVCSKTVKSSTFYGA
jgi:hypothetical protein